MCKRTIEQKLFTEILEYVNVDSPNLYSLSEDHGVSLFLYGCCLEFWIKN